LRGLLRFAAGLLSICFLFSMLFFELVWVAKLLPRGGCGRKSADILLQKGVSPKKSLFLTFDNARTGCLPSVFGGVRACFIRVYRGLKPCAS